MRNPKIIQFVNLFLKGMGMGAANIIPGVSGGTIALITGIFETLINSLKSFDLKAITLFFTGKWKSFAKHINLAFLIPVFAGILISIYSLARLLDTLFVLYPVLVWAFFFGLIMASVYFVGKTVRKITLPTITSFLIGTGIAVAIALLKPAQANDQLYYLFICGIVAVCSMILPGLSGSFVLILMGNYQLVMLDAVKDFDMTILLPGVVGAVVGLLAFSHLLSWIFKRYKDQTIALLTGFMLGSLMILWPWKDSLYKLAANGEFILDRSGDKILEGFAYYLPEMGDLNTYLAIASILIGALLIIALEIIAKKTSNNENN